MKAFKFKQFEVEQDRCAMKIGTDSVLLGAWTAVDNYPFSILDIGAGTGVLSLMMAQRCNAELIDAIEIDDDAYEQCVSNFEQSAWGDRLFCYHASLLEFTEEVDDTYDIIISNPPFYAPTLSSNDDNTMSESRKTARFTDALPFEHLITSASKLLTEDGTFNVIIPFEAETHFIDLASKVSLYPNHILHVQGTPASEVKRSLISFSFENKPLKTDTLIIETSRHQYTEDYINLTKDFYQKM